MFELRLFLKNHPEAGQGQEISRDDENARAICCVCHRLNSLIQAKRNFPDAQVDALGVPMCRPLRFGTCAEGVYSLQSWIEGQDAECVIPVMPASEQRRFGVEAGRILKRIHTLPAPIGQEDWASRFNRKIDRKIKLYADCPVKIKNSAAFIAAIDMNRHLLCDSPQVFQHGDYHIGNMMVDTAGQLVIIDFNRHDFGDPCEEFNRIVWDVRSSPARLLQPGRRLLRRGCAAPSGVCSPCTSPATRCPRCPGRCVRPMQSPTMLRQAEDVLR